MVSVSSNEIVPRPATSPATDLAEGLQVFFFITLGLEMSDTKVYEP